VGQEKKKYRNMNNQNSTEVFKKSMRVIQFEVLLFFR
jgi:hypothetical protein